MADFVGITVGAETATAEPLDLPPSAHSSCSGKDKGAAQQPGMDGGQRANRPFGIDQAALYPLFTPEVIQVMRQTIPAGHHGHVATGVIVKAANRGSGIA